MQKCIRRQHHQIHGYFSSGPMVNMENCQPIDPLVQLNKHLINDSMVNCIMCGHQMPLSQLVAHQKQFPSRPKWKTGFIARDHKRCIFCLNHPWVPKIYMDRHLRRKHPNELRAKKVQPAKKIIKTEICVAGDEVKMEKATTLETVSLESSIPQSILDVAEAARVPHPVSQFSSAKGYVTLSVERDVDGFDELIFTLM